MTITNINPQFAASVGGVHGVNFGNSGGLETDIQAVDMIDREKGSCIGLSKYTTKDTLPKGSILFSKDMNLNELLIKAGIKPEEIDHLINRGHIHLVPAKQIKSSLYEGTLKVVHPFLAKTILEKLPEAERSKILNFSEEHMHLGEFPSLKTALAEMPIKQFTEATEKSLSSGGRLAFANILDILKRIH